MLTVTNYLTDEKLTCGGLCLHINTDNQEPRVLELASGVSA